MTQNNIPEEPSILSIFHSKHLFFIHCSFIRLLDIYQNIILPDARRNWPAYNIHTHLCTSILDIVAKRLSAPLLQPMLHMCYKSEYFIADPYRLCGESIRPCFSYQSRGIPHLANRCSLRHFIDEDSLIVRYKRHSGAERRENKVRRTRGWKRQSQSFLNEHEELCAALGEENWRTKKKKKRRKCLPFWCQTLKAKLCCNLLREHLQICHEQNRPAVNRMKTLNTRLKSALLY
jgi:hypothetical protein